MNVYVFTGVVFFQINVTVKRYELGITQQVFEMHLTTSIIGAMNVSSLNGLFSFKQIRTF